MLKFLLPFLLILTVPGISQKAYSNAKPQISSSYRLFMVGKNFSTSSLTGHVYLLTTAENISIDEVKRRQEDFSLLHDEIPTLGMDSRFHWIRYQVRNASPDTKNLIADIRYNELNDVCFYVLDSIDQVTYSREHFNRKTHISKKPVHSRFFSFPLRLKPGETVSVYWRLYRRESFIVVPAGLFDQEYFFTFNATYDFFLYLSLGVFTFTFLLSLLLYIFTKYRLLLLYSGYTLFYGLSIASMEGILTQYFHLNFSLLEDNTKNVFFCCLNFFVILFAVHFLEIRSFLGRKIYRLCIAQATLVLLFGVYLLLTPFTGTTSLILSAVAMFDMLLVLSLVITALLYKKRIAILYLIAMSPLFVSASWMILTIIFGVTRTAFFYQSFPFLPFFEMIVLGIGLGYKLIIDRNHYLIGLNTLQKQFTSSIVNTQDAERQRIAADLHDDLGGTLATIRRRLWDLRFKINNENLAKELDELDPLILKSSDDLRRISHNLMPPEFERIGFANSLKQFVTEIPSQPTKFQFVVSGDVQKMPLEVELNAYRIVSEMVQNIFKHANAARASVQLLYQSDFLRVVIEDDGNGDKVEKSSVLASGMGLKNSILRADYIGASLLRESGEAGTFVILDIPYRYISNDADEPNQDTAGR